jgi:SPP1 family predicted phage head-tail adaptor
MDAKRYRQRITNEARQDGRGALGQVVVTWVDAFPAITAMGGIAAQVLTGPGREFRAAGGEQAETAARINLRYIPGIEQSMRVLWDGLIYNIRSIEFDATGRREVRLICDEGVNDGR